MINSPYLLAIATPIKATYQQGLLFPSSTLSNPWYMMALAFVAINTLIYVGLTLVKLIPLRKQKAKNKELGLEKKSTPNPATQVYQQPSATSTSYDLDTQTDLELARLKGIIATNMAQENLRIENALMQAQLAAAQDDKRQAEKVAELNARIEIEKAARRTSERLLAASKAFIDLTLGEHLLDLTPQSTQQETIKLEEDTSWRHPKKNLVDNQEDQISTDPNSSDTTQSETQSELKKCRNCNTPAQFTNQTHCPNCNKSYRYVPLKYLQRPNFDSKNNPQTDL